MNHEVRFSVYEHRLVDSDQNIIRRSFIVLKDEDGDILLWTDFHRYARGGRKVMVRNVYSDDDKRLRNIVKLLNYVFFDRYQIRTLRDIEPGMVKDFLNDYGLCRLPDDDENVTRNKQTVTTCISHIVDFLDSVSREVPGFRTKPADLYRTEKVFDRRRKRYVDKKIPVFEVNYRPKVQPIFRDLTEEAFQIIMSEITENHVRILMLAALSAFAGLRPAESCNVRRVDSALGPGMRFEMCDGEVANVVIDLREEKNLRSDLVSVGGIKKAREQKVYPAFLEVFTDCYNQYMEYMAGRKYEEDYGALTVTSTGKAYTYAAYYQEFQKVIADCIPKMLASDNPKTVNYGMLLQEHSVSPHILRHWYSVKLTLYGEDVAGLMSWRGDKSPESALTYISNKSELVKQLETVGDQIFQYNLWRAGKIMDKKKDKQSKR